MNSKKRIVAFLLTFIMLIGLFPATAFADDDHTNQVHVVVENTTFLEEVEGAVPDWTGTLVDTWVDIDDNSTMMTSVVAALDTVGATQEGAESNYISSINELEAFDGGSMSGWMGTLNDWFTNEGFGAYTVAAGTLEAGDEISIMYTQDYGEDLGGSWNNNDKTVKEIYFSVGILGPDFNKDTHTYTLTVPEGTEGVIVTPTATNKNFQVRTSVGSTEYKRTATVPIEDGAVITVKCGDSSWPTMNDTSSVPAETYTITVSAGEINTPPARKDGISATLSETVVLGDAYTLDLATIFEDVDEGDTLTYNVSIDGADAVNADESYSYTPQAADEYTLVFTANDGTADSTDTYTVTLTAVDPAAQGSELSSLFIFAGYSASQDSLVLRTEGDDTYGTNAPEFISDTLEYTINYSSKETTLRIQPVVEEEGATVTLYYPDGSGGTSASDITPGSSSRFYVYLGLSPGKYDLSIVVTPPEGSANVETTYILHTNCNPYISYLYAYDENDMELDITGTQYNQIREDDLSITVQDTVESIRFEQQAQEGCTITFNGSEDTAVDISETNTILITTTAGSGQDALSRSYNLTVNKKTATKVYFDVTPDDAQVYLFRHQDGYDIMPANGDGSYNCLLDDFEYYYTITRPGYQTVEGTVPADYSEPVQVTMEQKEESIGVEYSYSYETIYDRSTTSTEYSQGSILSYTKISHADRMRIYGLVELGSSVTVNDTPVTVDGLGVFVYDISLPESTSNNRQIFYNEISIQEPGGEAQKSAMAISYGSNGNPVRWENLAGQEANDVTGVVGDSFSTVSSSQIISCNVLNGTQNIHVYGYVNPIASVLQVRKVNADATLGDPVQSQFLNGGDNFLTGSLALGEGENYFVVEKQDSGTDDMIVRRMFCINVQEEGISADTTLPGGAIELKDENDNILAPVWDEENGVWQVTAPSGKENDYVYAALLDQTADTSVKFCSDYTSSSPYFNNMSLDSTRNINIPSNALEYWILDKTVVVAFRVIAQNGITAKDYVYCLTRPGIEPTAEEAANLYFNEVGLYYPASGSGYNGFSNKNYPVGENGVLGEPLSSWLMDADALAEHSVWYTQPDPNRYDDLEAAIAQITHMKFRLGTLYEPLGATFTCTLNGEIVEYSEISNVFPHEGTSTYVIEREQIACTRFDVVVTPPEDIDGAQERTYTFIVPKLNSGEVSFSDATLSSPVNDKFLGSPYNEGILKHLGSASTGFDPDVYDYTSKVNYNIDNIALGAQWLDSGMVVTCSANGGDPVRITENGGIAILPLDVGENIIALTGENGFGDNVVTKTYTITVTRKNNYNIDSITAQGMTIAGVLGNTRLNITGHVDAGVSEYTAVFKAENAAMTVTVSQDGDTVATGTGEVNATLDVAVISGTESTNPVSVTVGDGEDSITYTFNAREHNGYGPNSTYAVCPAPGQFINESWSNWYGPIYSSGGMSLGMFGGNVIYQFDDPIENSDSNPYGVDFMVNGNNFEGWSEPAGIMVAQDKDGDGKPDKDGSGNELWYSLAGSEHYEQSTIWDYEITYTNINTDFFPNFGENIPWTDNYGGSGYVLANGYHSQGYYPNPANYNFEDNATPVDPESITLNGVKLDQAVTAFGYAESSFSNGDTNTNGSNPYVNDGGDGKGCMDIAWAVDMQGNPVELDEISFVKIYTAVQIDGGAVGELSPEITSVIRADSNDAPVGRASELTSVTLSDGVSSLDVPMQDFLQEGIGQYSLTLIVGDLQDFNVAAESPDGGYMFINNERASSGIDSQRTFSIENGGNPTLVRIMAQNGEKEPVIYLLRLINDTTDVEFAKLSSLLMHIGYSPTDSTVLLKNQGDWYETTLVFDSDTQSYTLEAQTDSITQLRFRALAADDGAAVTLHYLDGESKDITWTSGSSKWANCLAAGKNLLKIVVTPPDGSDKLPTVYTINIDCVPTLSELGVTSGDVQLYLDEQFDSETMEYGLTVPQSAATVDVGAIPESDAYTITYNDSDSSTVDISSADKIDIVVTGGTGKNELSNTYTLNLTKVAQLDFRVNAAPENAIVKVYDQNGASISKYSNGSFSGMFGTYDYTYTVTKYGYVSQSGIVPQTGGTLDMTLAKAADDGLADVSAYWKNFRGSDSNMAITDVELPTDTQNINLKWNAQLGSGWSAAPSIQIIVNDTLVVMAGTTIYKLDLQTGETLATGTMAAVPNWGYTPPSYAEGMIFAPLTDGTVQAFNAETLESLWVYTDNLGGQSLSPITYNDGYIYTGFWTAEYRDANFVCLSVTDEDVTQTVEPKLATWKHTQQGGFYWAGSVVIGDAVIVGTDDGAGGCTGSSKLYSFNQFTGEILSELDIIGDQRSSIAYDSASGKIYFTTKCGYLYSANVNAATGVVSGLTGVNHNAQSTSTPVVYKDRVYIGVGSGISATGSSGNLLVADADSLEMLYAVGLKGYPQCSMLMTTAYEADTNDICMYSTYNSMPGGISMIKIDPDATTIEGAELIELYDAAGFSQYCITSLICGGDGTIYYKNDSGNVLAVGIPEAVGIIKLINAIGTVTLDSGNAIIIARNAYNALPDDEKGNVTNYTKLVAAENTFSALQVSNVENLIDAVGVVTINSEDAIQIARNAYNALTTVQKPLVDNLSKLTAAEIRYAQIVIDVAAAAVVDAQIGAMGTVTLESIGRITVARSSYDALTNAQKYRVTEFATLTAAEARYDELKAAADQAEIDEAATVGVERLIRSIGTVTLDSEEDIAAARTAYNGLTSTQKRLVSNYSVLRVAETEFAELKEATDTTEQVTVTLEDEDVTLAGAEGIQSVTIDGVTYEVDAQIAQVMTKIEGIVVDENGEPDINSVIMAYLAYQELTDDQKLFVADYDKLEAYMQTFAEKNHNDEETNISISGLDWYIEVTGTVQPLDSEEAAALQQMLGQNTLLMMADISLYDLINDREYVPGEPVTVRLPLPDMESYDGIVIVHQSSDGTKEYIEATVEGDELVFTATSFSYYGVVGYNGLSPLELGGTQDLSWLIWLGIGVVLIAVFIAMMAGRRKKAVINE